MVVNKDGEEAFFSQFVFDDSHAALLSIEIEGFFLNARSGVLAPAASMILPFLDPATFSAEPSACQLEAKNNKPHSCVHSMLSEIDALKSVVKLVANGLGYTIDFGMPVAPADMPQNIYPTTEYRAVAEVLAARGILLPALRITSEQLNIGCPDWPRLLDRYNRLVEGQDELIKMCDRSGGERLWLYREAVGNDPTARTIESPEALYQRGIEEGWAFDLRNWYDLIRIKARATGVMIEVRIPDAGGDLAYTELWVQRALEIAGVRL